RPSSFVVCHGHGHRPWRQDAFRLLGLLGGRGRVPAGLLGARQIHFGQAFESIRKLSARPYREQHNFEGVNAPRHRHTELRSRAMPEIRARKFTDTSYFQTVTHPVPTRTMNPWAVRAAQIDPIGRAFLRYGLVVAIGWIAAMKATLY